MGARVLGLIASLLLVAGSYTNNRLPVGTWNDRSALLRSWRGQAHAESIGLALSAVALVLLTVAWILLVRRVRGRPDGVGMVVVTILVWAAPLFVAGPVFSGDGWSYVATGYLTGHGFNPYHVGVDILPERLRSGVSPSWLNTPTPYGPLPLLWGAGFSRLTANPWVLFEAYRLLALLGVLGLVWGVARLARRQRLDPAVAVALAAASPFVIAHGIGGLHNDILVVALGVAALALTEQRRWFWPAVLVGAAAAVKIPGAFFGVGVVLASLPVGATLFARMRRTVEVAVVAAAVLVGSGFPARLGIGWLSALSVPDSGRRIHLAIVPTLAAAVRSIAHAEHARAVVHAFSSQNAMHAATALAVILATMVLLLWRTGPERAVLTGAAVAMLAVTVFSPVVHYWYFLWCIPVLGALHLPRRWAAAVLAEVVALGLTAVCDPSLHIGWLSAVGLVAVFGAPFVGYFTGRTPLRNVVTGQ